MLETLNMDLDLSKSEFKTRKRDLEYRLFNLAHATWMAKIPVLILLRAGIPPVRTVASKP